MKQINGSRTEKNLLAAFAGESQARNRDSFFAGRARKDGLMQIAAIFEETANQEKEHAKRFFQFLEGGELGVTTSFPAAECSGAPWTTCSGPRGASITNTRNSTRVFADCP